MTVNGWLQIAIFAALVAAVTLPLGGYMAKVFAGERTPLSLVLRPIESVFYRLSGVDPIREQNWLAYAFAVLLFNLVAFLLLFALQRLQGVLPLNPQGFAGVAPDLALNTSISFVTNTNWQNYGGESTLSYLVQMAGLTVHNFVSAANGIVVAIVLIRGFARKSVGTIGNFWADLTRCTLYVLLPISLLAALFLIWQGMPQNLNAYTEAATLAGAKQPIAQGPVA